MEYLQPYFISIVVICLFSAFVKCVTTFSILKYGLGLRGLNVVILILSFCLSLMILCPQLEKNGGFSAIFLTNNNSIEKLNENFSPILKQNADKTLINKFTTLAIRLKGKNNEVEACKSDTTKCDTLNKLSKETDFAILVTSYILTEIKNAFEIGIYILIPFLILDLIVTNVLLLIGAVNIQQDVVTLPLKILLFFVVDGWGLLTEKIIGTYL